MLTLSGDIGTMADRIGEMANRILAMADNIGAMADKLVYTIALHRITSYNVCYTKLLRRHGLTTI